MANAYGAEWYDDGVNEFTYAKNMSIPTYPNATLKNFPFVINITDADISASAQSDCDDITFVNSLNNTKLSHEIENCDLSANDWFTAWLNIPIINNTGDNWWMVYYGDGDASSQEDVSGTWNLNYTTVHHLHDDFLDSTANNCDITSTGTTDYSDQHLADSESFDGINDKLEVDDNGDGFNECLPNDTNGFYISLWAAINGTCNGGQCSLVTHRPSLTANLYGQWSFYENGGNLHFDIWNTAYLCIADTVGKSYDDNVWRHYAVEYIDGAGGDCDIWVNGVEVETSNKASALSVNTNGQLDVGWQTRDGNDFFHGKIDQFSIQNYTQPEAWIQYEYCNQSEESKCDSLDVGAEGTEPSAGDTVTVSDEIALEDGGATFIYDVTVNPSDELALEDVGATGTATGSDERTVNDEIALEDGGATAATDTVFVSDEIALEDTASTPAQATPTFNAIILSLNSPTLDRLGGVFALTCPSNHTLTGLLTNGTLVCTSMDTFFP